MRASAWNMQFYMRTLHFLVHLYYYTYLRVYLFADIEYNLL